MTISSSCPTALKKYPPQVYALWTLAKNLQGIGAAQDAARMTRVVSFYEKLPRGPAETPKPRGLMERYQARYFGDNPSSARKCYPLGSMVSSIADMYSYLAHYIGGRPHGLQL